MTKAELIDFLNKNFADDEEVTFLYNDDGYDERGVAKDIKVDTKTYCKTHYEVEENGVWVRWENDNCNPSRDEEYCKKWGHKFSNGYGLMSGADMAWYRQVVDKEWEDTKKCIVIV